MDKKLLLLLALLPLISPVSLQATPMNTSVVEGDIVDRMDQARPQPTVDPVVVLEVNSKDVGSKNSIKEINEGTEALTVNVVYDQFGGEVSQGHRDNIRNDIIEALDGKLKNLPNLTTLTIDLSRSNFDLQGIMHRIDLSGPISSSLRTITLIGPKNSDLQATTAADINIGNWLIRPSSEFTQQPPSSVQVWSRNLAQ